MTPPTPDWQSDCGRVTLYQGDCLTILPHLAPGSVDAVVTDCYNSNHEQATGGKRAAADGSGSGVVGSGTRDTPHVPAGSDVPGGYCGSLRNVAGRYTEGNEPAQHQAQTQEPIGRGKRAIQARDGINLVSQDGQEEVLRELPHDGKPLRSPQERGPFRQQNKQPTGDVYVVSQPNAQIRVVERPAVLVTDPPYGMKYSSGWQKRPIAGDGDTDVRDKALSLWDGPAVVFGRWDCPRPSNVRARLVWNKGDWPGMGDLSFPWGPSDEEIYIIGSGFTGRRSGTILHCNRLTGDIDHPNEKPVPLLSALLDKCPPGTILDPFMGSGTTGVACVKTGRKFIGIELEPKYFEIAKRRISEELAANLFLQPGVSA